MEEGLRSSPGQAFRAQCSARCCGPELGSGEGLEGWEGKGIPGGRNGTCRCRGAQGTYRERQLDDGQGSLGSLEGSSDPESQPSIGHLILEPGGQ